jgi:hypothetical protein
LAQAAPPSNMATMSEVRPDKAAFRIRDRYEGTDKGKGYTRTCELVDEQSQETAARCDLFGNAALKPQTFLTADGRNWRLEPNRKLMPNLWTLVDSAGQPHWQYRQKVMGKLVNPFHKTLVTLVDAAHGDELRFVDLDSTKIPVVLGFDWGRYALVRGKEPLATLTTLPKNAEAAPRRKGVLGALRRFMQGSDTAFVSTGSSHPIPAQAVMAMYLLYRELTDVSGAD